MLPIATKCNVSYSCYSTTVIHKSLSSFGDDIANVIPSFQGITTNNAVIKLGDAFDKAKTHPFLVMTYPENIKSDKKKHKYEARKALEILSDKESRELIKGLCRNLMVKLEDTVQEDDVYIMIGNKIRGFIDCNDFPVHRAIRDIKTKEDFMSELFFAISDSNEDSSIHAISLIWSAVAIINNCYNSDSRGKIRTVYKLFNERSRSHNIIKSFKRLPRERFGEAEIKSSLLKNLHPLYKLSSRYVKIKNGGFKKFIDPDNLYLSGTSGMCNAFYNIYSLLDIVFTSDYGIKLAEIMSSFVVGIGFHTFQEAYDSFNITHHSLYPIGQVEILSKINGIKVSD